MSIVYKKVSVLDRMPPNDVVVPIISKNGLFYKGSRNIYSDMPNVWYSPIDGGKYIHNIEYWLEETETEEKKESKHKVYYLDIRDIEGKKVVIEHGNNSNFFKETEAIGYAEQLLQNFADVDFINICKVVCHLAKEKQPYIIKKTDY